MASKAKELEQDPRKAQPYRAPDPARVRHDTLWHEAQRRWRPGRRVWIETSG